MAYDAGYIAKINQYLSDPNLMAVLQNDISKEGGSAERRRQLDEKKRLSQDINLAQSFKSTYGRDITLPELQSYVGMDQTAALQTMAQNYLAEQNSPEALAKKQEATRAAEAPKYQAQVADLFKSVLNRDPSKEELSHFSNMMADKTADAYTLGEALKTLPEYLQTQDKAARESLRGELSTADQQFYQQKILPSIQAAFAAQGRQVDSSGFAAALANAAQDVNNQREQYLAQVGREDYVNQRQQAINTYLDNLQRTYSGQDYARARTDQLNDMSRARQNEINDFYMQQRAYDQYVQNQGRRKGFLGQGIGSLVGMGAGALLALPTGGMSVGAGAMLGGMMGGSGGSLFDNY